jgi:GNAT superfamily N-acetyltransferase
VTGFRKQTVAEQGGYRPGAVIGTKCDKIIPMDWKICTTDDLDEVATLNGLLHEGEGAVPMDVGDIGERLSRWLASDYTAVLFSTNGQTVAYALFRPTDKDSEGLDPGVFIRQFYVVRDRRRSGVGRQAFEILRDHVWPTNCGILLDTEYENSRAQNFWRSVGFSEYQLTFRRQPSP